MIEIGDRRYRDDQAIVIGCRVGHARHPEGTETRDRACPLCGHMMRIDLRSVRLEARFGRPVVCLHCAAERYPGVVCGSDATDGRPVTLGEAVANGWIKIPPREDDRS